MEFRLGRVPFYAAAPELAVGGKFPGGTFSNYRYFNGLVDADASLAESLVWLLYDAQTSGGLLAVLPPAQADEALRALHDAGVTAASIVGRVIPERRLKIVA